MARNSSLRRFLHNVYGYAFFNKLILLTPVYAVFMQSHGLGDIQLALMFVILSAGTLLMQIPVTWVTNKVGPKPAIILGQLSKAAAFILWYFWPNFVGFAIGMFLWGVEWAFFNVAFGGLGYDDLRARRHSRMYARVLGVRYNVQAIGTALSAFGSLLMFAGYGWITVASLVAIGASIVCIMRMKLHVGIKKHQAHTKTNFIKLFKTGVRICGKTPCILLMLLLSLFIANIAYLDDFLSPIGMEIGMPIEYVGIIQFFILGCAVLGQTFAYRFTRIRDWILYTTICAAGALFVAFAMDYSLRGLWALGAAYVLFSGINILLYSRFQDFLPPRYRSVILSLYSIGDNIIYIGTCLVVGLGGMLGSWRYSVMILGMILIGVGLWALLCVRGRCAIAPMSGAHAIKQTYPRPKA